MIYGGPGFLARPNLTPLLSRLQPVSFSQYSVCRQPSLLTGGGGGGAESFDARKPGSL